MRYTTTKCSNCGFRTRNHESNVPSVQLGSPVLHCPRCGHLILDTIATEYEFMTDYEREKFTTSSLLFKSFLGNVLFIVVGLFILIGGLITGDDYVVLGVIFGGGCLCLGICQIIRNLKMRNEHIIEQAIYESLKRTQNVAYVSFIKESYTINKIKRNYHPFPGKVTFIRNYAFFEEKETYLENMKEFADLMNLIGNDISREESKSPVTEKAQSYTFMNP